MAIRKIAKIGDNVLREHSKPVKNFDTNLGILLDDMVETMFYENGVGLAAPQVSILKRICVVSVDGKKVYELINPEIVHSEGTQRYLEGCLSIPDESGYVDRPQSITVKYQDRNGKNKEITVSDFTAVAFCHEIDHLDGVLFIDKISSSDMQKE